VVDYSKVVNAGLLWLMAKQSKAAGACAGGATSNAAAGGGPVAR
jgi:hypothetical protein